MIFTRKFLKLCGALIVFLSVLNIVYIFVVKSRIDDVAPKLFQAPQVEGNPKVSWEDIDFINYEKTRVGPGEHGDEVVLTDLKEIEINEGWINKEGFYVGVSNNISYSRALPEHRPAVCPSKTYFKHLPNVSVIVTFHNEVLSTLLRCVHSIYNRSPKELLHEIVLINDKSTFPELYDTLRKYVDQNFRSTVKLYENEERQGLIKARMTGAKKATGEVLIFLDSHMEVFNSWLPPLLDPIVSHPTFATVPVSDGMHAKTFRPQHTGYGHRGVFDWNFRYQWLPLRPQDRVNEGEPYELACMTGGSYAIRRDQFFHLGGYDEGLLIWNGENYELSLKLWLCGGGMFEIPCSRVCHLSKYHSAYRNTDKPMDFVGRNLKRVAEVWLDDYKKYFYRGDPQRYAKIDPGDLSAQFAKKKSLNCKPFKYYLEVVAPDMLERYPTEPNNFAAGKVESLAKPQQCIGMPRHSYQDPVELVDCKVSQRTDLTLGMERSIKYNDTNDQCLDAAKLSFSNCHHQGGNQHFKFNLETRQIEHPATKLCMSCNTNDTLLILTTCDSNVVEQKWKWSYENLTALTNWDNVGVKMG